MSSNSMKTLGVAQIAIRFFRLQALRGGWAYFRIPVLSKAKSNSLEVVDNRPKVVEAAEEVFKVSADINLSKRKRASTKDRDVLHSSLQTALANLKIAFQSPAIVSVEDSVTVGGGTSYQRIILNDPQDVESDAVLDVIRTHGQWHRDPFRSPFMPIYANRSSDIALHLIYANDEGPVTLWELGDDRVRSYRLSFPHGFSMETYEKTASAESEEEEEIEVAGEATLAQAPPDTPEDKPERKRKPGNGKIETECPECGQSFTVKAKDLAAGKAKCPHCETILTSEE